MVQITQRLETYTVEYEVCNIQKIQHLYGNFISGKISLKLKKSFGGWSGKFQFTFDSNDFYGLDKYRK